MGAAPAPRHLQKTPTPLLGALTSKAAMPAATPPTTSAFVLMSSKIWSKQPCGSSKAGEDGHGAAIPQPGGISPRRNIVAPAQSFTVMEMVEERGHNSSTPQAKAPHLHRVGK